MRSSGSDVLSLRVQVATADRKVTVKHRVLGGDDPRCSPGTLRTQVYGWRAGTFVQTSVREAPA